MGWDGGGAKRVIAGNELHTLRLVEKTEVAE
jgi:hypothetical protein